MVFVCLIGVWSFADKEIIAINKIYPAKENFLYKEVQMQKMYSSSSEVSSTLSCYFFYLGLVL